MGRDQLRSRSIALNNSLFGRDQLISRSIALNNPLLHQINVIKWCQVNNPSKASLMLSSIWKWINRANRPHFTIEFDHLIVISARISLEIYFIISICIELNVIINIIVWTYQLNIVKILISSVAFRYYRTLHDNIQLRDCNIVCTKV